MTSSPQPEQVVVQRNCTTCQYPATCRFVDLVQYGGRLCPLVAGTPVKQVSPVDNGGLREARRRMSIYQRMGVHVIFKPYDRQRASTVEDHDISNKGVHA